MGALFRLRSTLRWISCALGHKMINGSVMTRPISLKLLWSPDEALFFRITVIKVFLVGIILGVAGVLAGLHYVPAVDQHREASIIAVKPNGGNTEMFHVKVPVDRIMIGASGQASPLPIGMVWPDEPRISDARVELFKLRNARDAVVGVATRLATNDSEIGDLIEWALHLPARGTVLVKMSPQPMDGNRRVGELTAGTREFGPLIGSMSERWVAEPTNSEDASSGRIELQMSFVSTNGHTRGEEVAE